MIRQLKLHGVLCLLLFPVVSSAADITLSTAAAEVQQQYGWKWGSRVHKDRVVAEFQNTGGNVILAVTGYDVDSGREVSVTVNDKLIGYLPKGPNNGLGAPKKFLISFADQIQGTNTVVFAQARRSGWKWGVTNFSLSESTGQLTDIVLLTSQVESGKYGWKWGNQNHKDTVTASFQSVGQNIELTATGYDIDNATEVSVSINGQLLGYLPKGVSNQLAAPETFSIEVADQVAGTNIIVFAQRSSGWKWGVTDISIASVVAPSNQAPIASADNITLVAGSSVTHNLLGNVTDADGSIDVSSLAISVNPLHGTLEILNGGSISYEHDGSENLQDSFSYTMRDNLGLESNVAEVAIVLEPVQPPVASDDTVLLVQGESTLINVVANDTTNGTLDKSSILIVNSPVHNKAFKVNDDGTIRYEHDGNGSTMDTIVYKVSNTNGMQSNEALVNITISAPENQAPVANSDEATVVAGSAVIIDVLANDSDTDGSLAAETVEIIGESIHGEVKAQSDGTVKYTHDGGAGTDDSLRYRVSDNLGLESNVVTVAITIEPIQPPQAGDDNVQLAKGASMLIDVLENDTTNSVLDKSSILIGDSPAHASTFKVQKDGKIRYTHDGGDSLSDSFAYMVANTNGMQSDFATVTVTIGESGGDHPPVAVDDTLTLVANSEMHVDVIANDSDTDGTFDMAVVKVVVAPSNGTATVLENGHVLYKHNGSATTEDSFGYTVSDNLDLDSNIATVFVTVEPVPNEAPVAADDAITLTAYDIVDIGVLVNDSDTDGSLDIASLTIVNNPAHGSYKIVDGIVTYTHDGNSPNSSDSFTYTIADDLGKVSNLATVNMTIEPFPSVAPIAIDDALRLVTGTSGVVSVLENDTDKNHDIVPASVEIVTHPLNGTAFVLADGTVQYEHDGSLTESDSLTYRVFDADINESDVATVIVTIDPPLNPVAADDAVVLAQGQSRVIDVLGNDSANTELDRTSIIITQSAQHDVDEGLVIQADGTILYTHSNDESLTDSFKYQVFNVQGMASNEAEVTITLGPKLITISDLSYEGAFTLPANDFGESNLNYAQAVIEVSGDSMFIVGHDHHDAIAEFTIPPLVNSYSLSSLNSAGNPVQNFAKVINRAATGNSESLDQITGLERVNGGLVINMMEFYDGPGDNTSTTMLINDASQLADSPVSAIHRMQGAARAAGWLSSIPEEWQTDLGASYISGHSSGGPIISRLSVGPSAFAVNLPDSLQSTASVPIAATELQGYSLSNGLRSDLFNESGSNAVWTHMSQARYGFIVPGTSTYVTLGWSAGHQTGVGYKNILEDGSECAGYCPKSSSDAYNYYWLWNVEDWMRVKAGEIEPYEIEPYEYGELDLPFQTDTYLNEVGGASYDAGTGLLYISILRANAQGYDNPPVIVAFKVN